MAILLLWTGLLVWQGEPALAGKGTSRCEMAYRQISKKLSTPKFTEKEIQAALARLDSAKIPGVPESHLLLRRRAFEHLLRSGLNTDRMELIKTFDVSEFMPVITKLRARLIREKSTILENVIVKAMKHNSGLSKSAAKREAETVFDTLLARMDAVKASKKLSYFDLLDITERGTRLRSEDPFLGNANERFLSSSAGAFPFSILIPSFDKLTVKSVSGDVAARVYRLGMTDKTFEAVDGGGYDRYGFYFHDEGHASSDTFAAFDHMNWSPAEGRLTPEVISRWLDLLNERAEIYRRVRTFIDRARSPEDRWYLELMWFFMSHEKYLGYVPEWHSTDLYKGIYPTAGFYREFITELEKGEKGLFSVKKRPPVHTSLEALWDRLFKAAYRN